MLYEYYISFLCLIFLEGFIFVDVDFICIRDINNMYNVIYNRW